MSEATVRELPKRGKQQLVRWLVKRWFDLPSVVSAASISIVVVRRESGLVNVSTSVGGAAPLAVGRTNPESVARVVETWLNEIPDPEKSTDELRDAVRAAWPTLKAALTEPQAAA